MIKKFHFINVLFYVFVLLKGGEFKCNDCHKLFKLKSSLERHRRVIHFEGETVDCPECGTRCPDKGTLARHMYTHTGEIIVNIKDNKVIIIIIFKTFFNPKFFLKSF